MQSDTAGRHYPHIALIGGLIFLAALSRLIPHPPNFTPVEAIGLFAGAYLADRRMALLVPLLAMAISDAILGFHSGMAVIYALIAFTVWLGLRMGPHPSALKVAGFGSLSAVIFFVVSNFAVWASGGGVYYTHDLAGLTACYVAAIPFFANSLAGLALYSLMLFGGVELLARRPQLAA